MGEMSKAEEVIIIGGGASGQAAALSLRYFGFQDPILILEKENNCGKKIRASGNGRCNLSHHPIREEDYHSHNPDLWHELFHSMPVGRANDFFQQLSLPVKWDSEGRAYPISEEAAIVQEWLLDSLEKANVKVSTDSEVRSIRRVGERFELILENGQRYFAKQVIIATGSQAAPHLTGCDSTKNLARELNLKYQLEVPTLVALLMEDKQLCRKASGARFKGRAKWRKEQVEGEFLFADDGLSGIAAMELSFHLQSLPGTISHKGKHGSYVFAKPEEIQVDFVSIYEEKELSKILENSRKNNPEADALRGILHSRILRGLEAQLGKKYPRTVEDCLNLLKHYKLRISGLRGFPAAQAAYGGIALSECNFDFSAKRIPGLWFCGEALDVVGNTGGYNFAFAFASASILGEALAKKSRA